MKRIKSQEKSEGITITEDARQYLLAYIDELSDKVTTGKDIQKLQKAHNILEGIPWKDVPDS